MTDLNVLSIRIKAFTADAQREMSAFAAKMKTVGTDAAGAMRQAEAAALDLNDVFAGKNGSFGYIREMETLRAMVDPTYAAMLRMRDVAADYATQRALVTAAQKAGELSDAEAARTLDLLAAKFQKASADAEAFAVDRRAAMAAGPVVGGGVTANIFAQMNDIGMMTAAGQNPLMLAIQQGSQLNQVWAQMGATGTSAFKAVGASLLAMLSPMNLATIAAIAGGAALVQWGMGALGAGEKTKTLKERMDDLERATRDYEAAAKAADQSLAELEKRYGGLADEVHRALIAKRQLAAFDATQAAKEAVKASSLLPAPEPLDARFFDPWQQQLSQIEEKFKITHDQAEALATATSHWMKAAANEDPKAMVETGDALREVLEQVFGSITKADEVTEDFGSKLVESTVLAAALASAGDRVSVAYGGAANRIDRMGDALKRVADLKKSSIDDLAMSKLEMQFSGDAIGLAAAKAEMEFNTAQGNRKMPEGMADDVERERQAYIDLQVQIEKNRQTVEALNDAQAAGATDGTMLAQLQEQAQLRALILKYGEDSVVVTMAHVAAEREVFAAQVEGWTKTEAITQETADALMEAWDAAEGLASVDIAGQIAKALGPASALSEYLRQAAGWWGSVQGVLQRASEGGGWIGGIVSRMGLGGTAQAPLTSPKPLGRGEGFGVDMDGNGVPDVVDDARTRGGKGGGGGGQQRDTLASVQAEAKKIMAELDRDIAAIQEKLRAGLIDQGGATEAIAAAKTQAANKLAEIIPQLAAFGASGAAAVDEWRKALAGLSTDLGDIGGDLKDTLTEGFGEAFASFIKGSATAQEAMDAFADKVISRLADIAAEQAVTGLLEPLFDSLFSGFSLSPSAKGNVFSAGAIVPFAEGGVPANRLVEVARQGKALNHMPPLATYANRVVDRPTLFPMPDGVGLMAEAGAEAIMPVADGGVLAKMGGRETRLPLTRGAGGRLGVEVPDQAVSAQPAAVPFAEGGVPGSRLKEINRQVQALNHMPPIPGFSNRVVDQPTLFAMPDGIGVMGEAGEEAIMPVGDGGVLAKVGGRETRLPLTRGAGGRLGVEVPDLAANALRNITAYAKGGVPGGAPGGSSGAAGFDGPVVVSPAVNVAVHVENVPAGHTARVEESGEGNDRVLRVILDQVGAGLAAEWAQGRGPLAQVMSHQYGLGRMPR